MVSSAIRPFKAINAADAMFYWRLFVVKWQGIIALKNPHFEAGWLRRAYA